MKKMDIEKALNETQSGLEKVVLQDMLDEENGEDYLKDVLNNGCQSGTVSGLIYYVDTKKFFIEHLDEIEELVEDVFSMNGELEMKYPMSNFLAWLAYEETARKIADKFNIEY